MKNVVHYNLFENSMLYPNLDEIKVESVPESLNILQRKFLQLTSVGGYEYNKDTGLVDIDLSFNYKPKDFLDGRERFRGIKFGKVKYDFNLNKAKIGTLEGCPSEVGGDFRVSKCEITSLEGGPVKVEGNYDCSYNLLSDLKGAPREVNGNFRCTHNPLDSLDGLPDKVGGFLNTDFFVCRDGEWSLEWAIENLENYKVLRSYATVERLQKLIDDDPSKAIITLKPVWNLLKKDPNYKGLRFPDSHKEISSALGDLADLGI